MTMFTVICLTIVSLAIVVKIAPGEPEWKHDSAAAASSDNDDDSLRLRFVGGDGSTMLTGRLFLPKEQSETKPPVIVLAHGLGLTQDATLDRYVNAFTSDSGPSFAAFTFDYATFGASDGFPRHQVNPPNHVADIQAAIRMLKERQDELQIDAGTMGLWGTSLGGGHVLVVAAAASSSSNDGIRAVVSQIPAILSGAESIGGTLVKEPVVTTLGLVKFLAGIVKWAATAVFSGKTTYVALHGLPGSFSLMQNPGDDAGYASLTPPQNGKNVYGWRNAATVGSGLRLMKYRPIDTVSQIKMPTLMIAAESDTLCPANNIERASKLIPGSELMVVPGVGHFDVYTGDVLQHILTATVGFFQKNLVPSKKQ